MCNCHLAVTIIKKTVSCLPIKNSKHILNGLVNILHLTFGLEKSFTTQAVTEIGLNNNKEHRSFVKHGLHMKECFCRSSKVKPNTVCSPTETLYEVSGLQKREEGEEVPLHEWKFDQETVDVIQLLKKFTNLHASPLTFGASEEHTLY